MKLEIKESLGVVEIKQYEKSLGFPPLVGRRKKMSFDHIKEGVFRKLQGLEEKLQ